MKGLETDNEVNGKITKEICYLIKSTNFWSSILPIKSVEKAHKFCFERKINEPSFIFDVSQAKHCRAFLTLYTKLAPGE
jgi:hypothetical protein